MNRILNPTLGLGEFRAIVALDPDASVTAQPCDGGWRLRLDSHGTSSWLRTQRADIRTIRTASGLLAAAREIGVHRLVVEFP